MQSRSKRPKTMTFWRGLYEVSISYINFMLIDYEIALKKVLLTTGSETLSIVVCKF